MTAPLLAMAAALAAGLPVLALGEHLRERKARRRRDNQYTPPTRKDIS